MSNTCTSETNGEYSHCAIEIVGEQGTVNTPTGCHLAEQTPLDQCYDKTTVQPPASGILPRTGSDINIVLPLVFTIIIVSLYLAVKKVIVKT